MRRQGDISVYVNKSHFYVLDLYEYRFVKSEKVLNVCFVACTDVWMHAFVDKSIHVCMKQCQCLLFECF